ncbi:hypothetical protein CC86DRAFT_161812 [Ophiobolus disseminans]|uniref:Uncharacterized protein n=1 Tax=Ophiobolus disseminans TaxID=1469910 RepID=A0A6A7AC72_9PLEO|nr:hypothetical protein CC86DRAFT_161812 [Ophiobolus disseminans]
MSENQTVCEKCASLSWAQITSEGGQIYHNNWMKLEISAKHGCRLCAFFQSARADAKSCPKLYSGTHGPIVLRVHTAYSALFMHVAGDAGMASYYLFLKSGVHPLDSLDHLQSNEKQIYQTISQKVTCRTGSYSQIVRRRQPLPGLKHGSMNV